MSFQALKNHGDSDVGDFMLVTTVNVGDIKICMLETVALCMSVPSSMKIFNLSEHYVGLRYLMLAT